MKEVVGMGRAKHRVLSLESAASCCSISPIFSSLSLNQSSVGPLPLLGTAGEARHFVVSVDQREHDVHVVVLVLDRVALQHLHDVLLVAVSRLLHYHVHNFTLYVFLELSACVSPFFKSVVQYAILCLQHENVIKPPAENTKGGQAEDPHKESVRVESLGSRGERKRRDCWLVACSLLLVCIFERCSHSPLWEEVTAVVVDDVATFPHALLQIITNLVFVQDVARQVGVPTVVQIVVLDKLPYLDVVETGLLGEDGGQARLSRAGRARYQHVHLSTHAT
mmetsp:Transcript_458/g.1197  ORF Transcript_458/g.1197 Transcript_458/m.1197 type:complete len:279 (+) Transcript_458:857-1693(+)